MNSLFFIVCITVLAGCFFTVDVTAYKRQKNVRANHDCSCTGFIAKAEECNWEDEICDEDDQSQAYINYQYWCDKLNKFRDDKREGNTPAEYNRSLTCQANMSREERDAIYANEWTAPTPRFLTGLSQIIAIGSLTADPATNIDWTSRFPPVKNQGSCGSCWAFAVVGYLEAYRSIRGSGIVALSEQHVVNCDTSNGGCGGGFTGNALDFLYNFGTTLSADIPYTGVKNATFCPATKPLINSPNQAYYEYYTSTSGSQGVTTPNGNCTRLRQLLIKGPVIASMHVDSGFYQYKSGAYVSKTCTFNGTTNHAMVVVGYGLVPNTTVNGFKVRNSWGSSWGASGYLWVQDNDRVCSLCSKLVYA